jgi:hypothetical protein
MHAPGEGSYSPGVAAVSIRIGKAIEEAEVKPLPSRPRRPERGDCA